MRLTILALALGFMLLFTVPAFCEEEATFPGSVEALDEVNAVRVKRGLKPFLPDSALSIAARSAAHYRAARGLAGHTPNDFAHIPAGGSANAAGCAAWPAEMGWGSCCTYESWTHAGAAYVVGRDGARYMHLFVRGSEGSGHAELGKANSSLPVRRGFLRRR